MLFFGRLQAAHGITAVAWFFAWTVTGMGGAGINWLTSFNFHDIPSCNSGLVYLFEFSQMLLPLVKMESIRHLQILKL